MKKGIITLILSLAVVTFAFSCSKGSKNDNQEVQDKTADTRTGEKDIKMTPISSDTVGKKKIVVIDYFATWCGPCRQLSPYFEKWANTYRKEVEFRKIDVDQDQMAADENDIQALPTVVIYSPEGDEITRVVGFDPEGIEQRIKQAVEANADSREQ